MRAALNPLRLVLPALLLAAPAFATDTYKIDASHSEVGFKVRHLISRTAGRFTKFNGTIQLDEQRIENSNVSVSIDVASINTDNANRDGHLRSADFFDAEKFPAITFKSTSVKEVSKGHLQVTGDFTMHGVTKSITIPITSLGGMATPFKDFRAGFEGSLKLNRQDFGVKWNKTLDAGGTMLSDDIDINLAIEAVKQAPEAKK
ncbi:MAG: YceI family protein [Holophagaceae bacterium]|nr:YceI family protein [Holophagaceae bacterium]